MLTFSSKFNSESNLITSILDKTLHGDLNNKESFVLQNIRDCISDISVKKEKTGSISARNLLFKEVFHSISNKINFQKTGSNTENIEDINIESNAIIVENNTFINKNIINNIEAIAGESTDTQGDVAMFVNDSAINSLPANINKNMPLYAETNVMAEKLPESNNIVKSDSLLDDYVSQPDLHFNSIIPKEYIATSDNPECTKPEVYDSKYIDAPIMPSNIEFSKFTFKTNRSVPNNIANHINESNLDSKMNKNMPNWVMPERQTLQNVVPDAAYSTNSIITNVSNAVVAANVNTTNVPAIVINNNSDYNVSEIENISNNASADKIVNALNVESIEVNQLSSNAEDASAINTLINNLINISNKPEVSENHTVTTKYAPAKPDKISININNAPVDKIVNALNVESIEVNQLSSNAEDAGAINTLINNLINISNKPEVSENHTVTTKYAPAKPDKISININNAPADNIMNALNVESIEVNQTEDAISAISNWCKLQPINKIDNLVASDSNNLLEDVLSSIVDKFHSNGNKISNNEIINSTKVSATKPEQNISIKIDINTATEYSIDNSKIINSIFSKINANRKDVSFDKANFVADETLLPINTKSVTNLSSGVENISNSHKISDVIVNVQNKLLADDNNNLDVFVNQNNWEIIFDINNVNEHTIFNNDVRYLNVLTKNKFKDVKLNLITAPVTTGKNQTETKEATTSQPVDNPTTIDFDIEKTAHKTKLNTNTLHDIPKSDNKPLEIEISMKQPVRKENESLDAKIQIATASNSVNPNKQNLTEAQNVSNIPLTNDITSDYEVYDNTSKIAVSDLNENVKKIPKIQIKNNENQIELVDNVLKHNDLNGKTQSQTRAQYKPENILNDIPYLSADINTNAKLEMNDKIAVSPDKTGVTPVNYRQNTLIDTNTQHLNELVNTSFETKTIGKNTIKANSRNSLIKAETTERHTSEKQAISRPSKQIEKPAEQANAIDLNNNSSIKKEVMDSVVTPLDNQTTSKTVETTIDSQLDSAKPVFENTPTQSSNIETLKLDNNLHHAVNRTFTNVKLADVNKVVWHSLEDMKSNTSKTSTHNIKIVMNPAALGEVIVEIKFSKNNTDIHFKAANRETLLAIEQNIDTLKDMIFNNDMKAIDVKYEKITTNNDSTNNFSNNNQQQNNGHSKDEQQKARQEYLNSILSHNMDSAEDLAQATSFYNLVEEYI